MGWVVKSRGYKSVIVDDEGLISAEVCGPGHAKHARLMAAAPAMAEALRLIADSEECSGDTFVCDFETLQSVARRALDQIVEAV